MEGGMTMSNPNKKIPLVEIFGPTIEGEGAVIGYQTIFLRFGGCDYRCQRCDSLHAVLPALFTKEPTTQQLTVEELTIITSNYLQFKTAGCEWITLSGGNPCMWDIQPLVETMQRKGKKFALETQGTLWQEWIPLCNKITISPKGPGMGEKFESDKFDYFIQRLRYHQGLSIKVVVFDQRDLDFVAAILNGWPHLADKMFISIGNPNPPAPAQRMQVEEETHEQFVMRTIHNMKVLLEDIMSDPRLSSVRVLPQLHTLLWANEAGK